MKVALVHDWLTGMRGGERVLEEFCKLFPDATLFTLFHHPGSVTQRIESMPIRTSVLNRIPGAGRHYRNLLPLNPWAVSRLDLSGFDLVLSSSHAVAKGIRKPRESIHICYCHTPMRYIWDAQSDYFHYGDPTGIRRTLLAAMKPPLRAWDRATSQSVDYFIANSRNVQERIARHYARPAEVVYPPVDTQFFTPLQNGNGASYHLVVSALVPFKRLDLAVAAFNQLRRPLVIVGGGPDLETLKKRAAANICFKGFVSDEELRELYRHCRSLIIPGREDFGIVSLEAQACGRPIVAYAAGGALESVSDGETGILFCNQTPESLIDAINRCERTSFDPTLLRANAERFSSARFREAIKETVERERIKNAPWSHGKPREMPGLHRLGDNRRHASLTGISGNAKRSLDLLAALCGLVLLGPLLLLTALLIRLTSRGSGFFHQRRLSLEGRVFMMSKLRTMHSDAEPEHAPIWAVDNDPRCTRLGGWLRRWSLDELPQLWSIIKGDMSLVGPRPERPELHEIFETKFPGFGRRLEVRGGLTGLAQIRGWRGDSSLEERLKADLEYIETWSVRQDILILLKTPIALWRASQTTDTDRQ
jgi:lipopolysaccharide/colanic/teichoic acid biosynthesis glycosyltransferase/glycosyltransferase involved in cell wall biosynthesis